MCGIIAAVGHENVASVLLQALKKLEYRGYDSAGICTDSGNQFELCKSVGKLGQLSSKLAGAPLSGDIGIGHTRWATHGGVDEKNAHPICAGDGRVAVVHNGIIENHRVLRKELEGRGHCFVSDTDSEVIAHLFVEALDAHDALSDATKSVLDQIEGAYAFVVMSRDHAGALAFARKASPLAVGLGDGAMYVGSDAMAMGDVTGRVVFLKDGDFGVVTAKDFSLYDGSGKATKREVMAVAASPGLASKDGYQHFMEKEIHEQPEAIAHTLAGICDGNGHLALDFGVDFESLEGLRILAAGTSHLAAMTGKYWFESLADLPASAEIASEFRYRNPSMRHLGAVMGISQSGESLDTLMALRHAADKGVLTIGLVNVASSTIAREVDHCLVTRAGIEVSVASTKSYMTQLTVLLGLAVMAGVKRGVLDKARAREIEQLLHSLPRLVGEALSAASEVRLMAQTLAKARSCLYLGRGTLYPLALEGALKLKELSYIHAEGYAAGEMKHGPIALIEEGLPVVAVLTHDVHLPKSVSNLMEVRARGAAVLVVATARAAETIAETEPDLMKMMVVVPECDPLIAPMVLAVPIQFLAYMTALHKGTDIDQPRNLAKSVTVE